jgi:hypothetical protein
MARPDMWNPRSLGLGSNTPVSRDGKGAGVLKENLGA